MDAIVGDMQIVEVIISIETCLHSYTWTILVLFTNTIWDKSVLTVFNIIHEVIC
jgi:hypothetical protein